MKTQNTNKGITLIALVITIIVMLILVAVTITMAVNGGLFEYAGRAGAETNTKRDAEQEYANLQPNMTYDELINKYTEWEEDDSQGGTQKPEQGEVQEINFSVRIFNKSEVLNFTAEEEMTWADWINSSKYNHGGLYLNGKGGLRWEDDYGEWYALFGYGEGVDVSYVNENDPIDPNLDYVLEQ